MGPTTEDDLKKHKREWFSFDPKCFLATVGAARKNYYGECPKDLQNLFLKVDPRRVCFLYSARQG